MLSRKSRGSECLGRQSRHCNSMRESTVNPEEIPLTSVKTTSDDTDPEDSPYRRPLFDTNERRRGDVNKLSKWYAHAQFLTVYRTPAAREQCIQGGTKNGLFLQVCNSLIYWHSITFYISYCSVFVQTSTGVLNITVFKYSLRNFTATTLR